MKTCKKCKTEKDIGAFSKNRSNSDGFQNCCKECMRDIQILYRKKQKEKGLCRSCSRERVNKQLCMNHRVANNKSGNKFYREHVNPAPRKHKFHYLDD